MIPAPTLPVQQTIRMKIMAEVRARLGQIKTTNQYQSNLGTNLWYGQQPTPEPHVLPIIYYWDFSITPTPTYKAGFYLLSVQIETYDRIAVLEAEQEEIEDAIVLAQQMPVVANQHSADVITALYRDFRTGRLDPHMCGLIEQIALREEEAFYGIQPGHTLWCGTRSLWELTYKTVIGDPYK